MNINYFIIYTSHSQIKYHFNLTANLTNQYAMRAYFMRLKAFDNT